MLPRCRSLLLFLLLPCRQSRLRHRDVVVGVVQPSVCDRYDRARQLVWHHALECLVEPLFLPVEQVVVRAALPGSQQVRAATSHASRATYETQAVRRRASRVQLVCKALAAASKPRASASAFTN